jgi:hypothetical protein
MFLLMILLSLRLLVAAIKAIPVDAACVLNFLRIPDWLLNYSDLFLLSFVTLAFCAMWWTHHQGSKKERSYHAAMWRHFDANQAPSRETIGS